jgi:hypothetical protein
VEIGRRPQRDTFKFKIGRWFEASASGRFAIIAAVLVWAVFVMAMAARWL